MSVFCSGNPGVAKPGFAATLFIGPSALGALLNNVKTPWAVGIAAYLGLLTYDLSTFCAGEPPTMPTMTAADYFDLITIGNPIAHAAAVTKWTQWVGSQLWDVFCECTVVATPSPPTPPLPPTGLGQILDGTSTILAMRQYQCKVLDLWNGTTNNTPPTGWDTVGFNDSAWADASSFSPAVSHVNVLLEEKNGVDITASGPGGPTPPYGAERVAPWVFPSSTKSEYLIRWYFIAPPTIPIDAVLSYYCDGNGAIASGTFKLNGSTSGALLNTAQIDSMVRAIQPGGNLLALWINSGNTTPLPTNSGEDWFSLAIHQAAVIPGITDDCCAQLRPLVSQILQLLLQLTQRPQGYGSMVDGTVHSGLTGQSFFTPAPNIVGLQVVITTMPNALGRANTLPERFYGVGSVAMGPTDGPTLATPVNYQVQFIYAAPLTSFVQYTFHPGVVATITEVIPGP